MNMLYRKQLINKDINSVYAFFARPENLSLITPSWLKFKILNKGLLIMKEGAIFNYKIKLNFLPTSWKTLITEYNSPFSFTDEQINGPYKIWKHHHKFTPVEGGTLIEDEVIYDVGWGKLGILIHKFFIKKALNNIFDYRYRKIDQIFNSHYDGHYSEVAT